MNDGEFQVDILDINGKINGAKKRVDIKKGVDIYHAVYGLVVTPVNEIVVSVIGNPPGMPNLHAGKHGCTAATIRRSGETAHEAMKRATEHELAIDVSPEIVSEEFIDIDNTKRLISFYKIPSEIPTNFSKREIEELKAFSPEGFTDFLANYPEKITPPLKLIWEKLKPTLKKYQKTSITGEKPKNSV